MKISVFSIVTPARTILLTTMSLVLLLAAADTCGQTVYSYRANRLMKRPLSEVQTNVFFESAGKIIVAIDIANLSERIGVLSQSYENRNADSVAGQVMQTIESRLEIIDSSGQLFGEAIERVQAFSLDANGRRVAMILGERPTERTPFIPDRLVVHNINTGESIEVLPRDGIPFGIGNEITWAGGDSIFFLSDRGEIILLDAASNTLTPSEIGADLNLSADGRFTLTNAGESSYSGMVEIIDLAQKANVSPIIFGLVGESLDQSEYGRGLMVGWLGDHGAYLGINMGARAIIINVASGEIIYDDPISDLQFRPGPVRSARRYSLIQKANKPYSLDLKAIIGNN